MWGDFMAFENSAIINYPVEKVFNVFIRSAKRDFPKFNEKSPVGCSVTKKAGAYAAQMATVKVEITAYEKNKLYEITTTANSRTYYSTYEFENLEDNKTKLTLIEEDKSSGIIPWLNVFFQNLIFKSRVKRRFTFFIEGLNREIEKYDEQLDKNSKSRAEEKAAIEAKTIIK